MVRLTHDGLLQFLGRIDGQVKIRGFRVELSEIEAVLMEYPASARRPSTSSPAGGLPEVAGYIIVDEAEGALDRAAIAEMLRSRLPEYMVPKYLDVVESLPTLTSGKVDRKQLPAPVNLLKGTDRQYVAPAGDLEQAVVAVWEKCFHTSPVSVEDDFFLDLGGHSLLAAQVVTELRRRFGTSRDLRARHLQEPHGADAGRAPARSRRLDRRDDRAGRTPTMPRPKPSWCSPPCRRGSGGCASACRPSP